MEKKTSLPILFPIDPDAFLERLRSLICEELNKATAKQTEMPQEETLMTRKEIASFLKISLVTLHDCMNRRGLPYHRKGWGPRFLKSEVIQWLKSSQDQQKGTD